MTRTEDRQRALPGGEDERPGTRPDRVVDLIAGSLFGSLFVVVPVGLAAGCVYLAIRLLQ